MMLYLVAADSFVGNWHLAIYQAAEVATEKLAAAAKAAIDFACSCGAA